MTRDDAMTRVLELLDELDKLKAERKAVLNSHDERSGRLAIVNDFKIRQEQILNDMLMCREDARQMRLEEVE